MDTTFVVKFFGALFALMNPFIGLPVFLRLTEGQPPAVQRKLALQVAFYITIIGTVTALVGTQVLKFFGISIHDLQVAGGMVVLGLAFTMLYGKDNSMHHGTDQEQASFANCNSFAFYPLAFPLMIGPGVLTTMILFAGQVKGAADWVGYFVDFAVVVLSVAVVFALGGKCSKHLSNTARVIMNRVMGLILAALAVQMIIDGLKVLLPGLAGS